jgi:hypothetical protein
MVPGPDPSEMVDQPWEVPFGTGEGTSTTFQDRSVVEWAQPPDPAPKNTTAQKTTQSDPTGTNMVPGPRPK